MKLACALVAAIAMPIGSAIAELNDSGLNDPRMSAPNPPPMGGPISELLLPDPDAWTFPESNFVVVDVLAAVGVLQLANSNMGNEPSLAVNPNNPLQIVLLSSFGGWAAGNASLWLSNNGGVTWTRPASIPPPPGIGTYDGCPCDQTGDFGPNGTLYITFLNRNNANANLNIYTGQSTNPAMAANWSWNVVAGVAQRTNSAGVNLSDQPWLWAGPRRPPNQAQTGVFVAYDAFTGGANPVVRVAASLNASPPNFPAGNDNPTTNAIITNFANNPGNRITGGPNGIVYNINAQGTDAFTTGLKNIAYWVNQTQNESGAWGVGPAALPNNGVQVGAGFSNQAPGSKFGGNNALLGSITAIGVDPNSGVVYAVFGTRDGAGWNRLRLRTLIPKGTNEFTLGPTRTLTGANRHAALPAVTVLRTGEVGVLFTTFDPVNNQYDEILVQSLDAGRSLAATTTLSSWANFAAGNLRPIAANPRQRILGDYVQLKSAGFNYHGAYPARGLGNMNNQNSVDPYYFTALGENPGAMNEACCLPDQTCRDLPAPSCRSLRGNPQGPGTTCASTNCLNNQACCLPIGLCATLPAAACVLNGGTPQGLGSVCTAAQACCFSNGSCSTIDPICCEALGGVPKGNGTSCTAVRACFLPNAGCVNVDVLCCDDLGGVPGPVGSVCAANRRCCLPGGFCSNGEPTACAMAGGTAGAAGSACAAPRRCRLPGGVCIDTDAACCVAAGGVAGPAGSACGVAGSCCLPDGSCVETDSQACGEIGGLAGSPGELCGLQACCMPDGTCVDAKPSCCIGMGGTPRGSGFYCLGDENSNLIDDQCELHCICLGDIDINSRVEGLDIAPFVDCLLGGAGPGCECADISIDSSADVSDIPLFVNLLLISNGPCQPWIPIDGG